MQTIFRWEQKIVSFFISLLLLSFGKYRFFFSLILSALSCPAAFTFDHEQPCNEKDWYSRSEIVHRNSKQPLMRPFQEPNQQTKAKKKNCFQMTFGNSGGQARLFNTTNTYFKALISITRLSRQRALVSLGLFTKMNGTLLCKLSISASQNKIALSIIHQIGFTHSCHNSTNSRF